MPPRRKKTGRKSKTQSASSSNSASQSAASSSQTANQSASTDSSSSNLTQSQVQHHSVIRHHDVRRFSSCSFLDLKRNCILDMAEGLYTKHGDSIAYYDFIRESFKAILGATFDSKEMVNERRKLLDSVFNTLFYPVEATYSKIKLQKLQSMVKHESSPFREELSFYGPRLDVLDRIIKLKESEGLQEEEVLNLKKHVVNQYCSDEGLSIACCIFVSSYVKDPEHSNYALCKARFLHNLVPLHKQMTSMTMEIEALPKYFEEHSDDEAIGLHLYVPEALNFDFTNIISDVTKYGGTFDSCEIYKGSYHYLDTQISVSIIPCLKYKMYPEKCFTYSHMDVGIIEILSCHKDFNIRAEAESSHELIISKYPLKTFEEYWKDVYFDFQRQHDSCSWWEFIKEKFHLIFRQLKSLHVRLFLKGKAVSIKQLFVTSDLKVCYIPSLVLSSSEHNIQALIAEIANFMSIMISVLGYPSHSCLRYGWAYTELLKSTKVDDFEIANWLQFMATCAISDYVCDIETACVFIHVYFLYTDLDRAHLLVVTYELFRMRFLRSAVKDKFEEVVKEEDFFGDGKIQMYPSLNDQSLTRGPSLEKLDAFKIKKVWMKAVLRFGSEELVKVFRVPNHDEEEKVGSVANKEEVGSLDDKKKECASAVQSADFVICFGTIPPPQNKEKKFGSVSSKEEAGTVVDAKGKKKASDKPIVKDYETVPVHEMEKKFGSVADKEEAASLDKNKKEHTSVQSAEDKEKLGRRAADKEEAGTVVDEKEKKNAYGKPTVKNYDTEYDCVRYCINVLNHFNNHVGYHGKCLESESIVQELHKVFPRLFLRIHEMFLRHFHSGIKENADQESFRRKFFSHNNSRKFIGQLVGETSTTFEGVACCCTCCFLKFRHKGLKFFPLHVFD